jgi:hypothetical protein
MTKYVRPCRYPTSSSDLNDEEHIVHIIGKLHSVDAKWPNFIRLRKNDRIRDLGIVKLEQILSSLVQRAHVYSCNDVYFLPERMIKSINRGSRLWRDVLAK